LAAGSWQLAVGSWQLAVGSWQLAVSSWQLAVGSWQLAKSKTTATTESRKTIWENRVKINININIKNLNHKKARRKATLATAEGTEERRGS